MIYQILRGEVLHTTPNIVRGILKNSTFLSPTTASQHYLCILMFGRQMLYDNVEKNPYDKLCQEYSFTNYKLFYTKWEFMKFVLTRKNSDKIIIHGNVAIKNEVIFNSVLLLFRRDILSQTTLICWGNNDFIKGNRLRAKLTLGAIRESVYKRYKNILTLSVQDREEVQALYPQAHVLYLPYFSLNKRQLLRQEKAMGEKCKVMVSHSGWPLNNHFKSFEILKKNIPNVHVICPLCYGDEHYIEEVIAKGIEMFGNDFEYFRDLRPNEEYKCLLRSLDVYVTAADRQTGLAAVYGAMEGGAKIFVTGNNFMSMKKEGYSVFNIDDLGQMTIDELKDPMNDVIAQRNIDIYNETHCNGKSIVEGWRNVYED